MMTPSSPPEPIADAPAPSRARGRMAALGGWMRARVWVFPPLLALIVLRLLLAHGNPTDFPQDRNITAAARIVWLKDRIAREGLTGATLRSVFRPQIEAPEFPLLPSASLVLTAFGTDPVVAARLVSLVAAVLTGLGIYILGRRIGPPALATLALWLYALVPMSILMGRVLLPDTWMVAALVWSLVAGGAGLREQSWRRTIGMTLWLVAACLFKLSAIFLAPVAALALMEAIGWRRKSAWIGVAASAAITYLVVCLYYKLSVLNPMPGLNRISANTNNLMISWGELWEATPVWVTITRAALSLTVPVLALALVGWAFWRARAGRPYWLDAWLIMGALFILVSVRANTYWAYALVPAGCLLASLGTVEILRLGRPAAAVLAVFVLVTLWMCPSIDKHRYYLGLRPEFKAAGEAMKRLPKGRTISVGQVRADIDFFAHASFETIPTPPAAELMNKVRSGTYQYVVSTHMAGYDVIADLLQVKPVLETRAGEYIIYDVSARAGLGEPVPANPPPPLTMNLDLGGGALRLRALQASSTRIGPGERLELTAIFEKGAAYKLPLNLALEFVHLPSGTAFPLPPVAGGALFRGWIAPMVQAPDFAQGTLERMRYAFPISPQMPAGPYALRFGVLRERRGRNLVGTAQAVDLGLQILPPATTGSAPQTINLKECLWLFPQGVDQIGWLGRPRMAMRLLSEGHLWARPNLPAGEYELWITGRGLPTGMKADRWPTMRIQQPGEREPREVTFNSESSRVHSVRLKWNGPGDCLHFTIANPAIEYAPRPSFPVYVDELAVGDRAVVIEAMEIEPVR